ncbi:hypothetical protein [Pseudomonas aeruginosa]|uniref:hypothetical protein n=1 Tax=Pseudomonas aeruginosa TaxID=287 RepID=UPI0034E05CBD
MTNTTPIVTALHSSANGFHDYDVVGHPLLRRVAIPHGIKDGEQFNVYYGEASKGGAVWRGGIEKSLEAWLSLHALTHTIKPKNDVAHMLLAKLAEVGRTVEPGYFGGHIYCAGVLVKDLPDACLLGTQLGEGLGIMGWDQIGPHRYIVFRDAHVSR